jgi:hypothetical protein
MRFGTRTPPGATATASSSAPAVQLDFTLGVGENPAPAADTICSK